MQSVSSPDTCTAVRKGLEWDHPVSCRNTHSRNRNSRKLSSVHLPPSPIIYWSKVKTTDKD